MWFRNWRRRRQAYRDVLAVINRPMRTYERDGVTYVVPIKHPTDVR